MRTFDIIMLVLACVCFLAATVLGMRRRVDAQGSVIAGPSVAAGLVGLGLLFFTLVPLVALIKNS